MSEIVKEETFITTFDNPFDPLTENDEWYNFDTGKGYFTCQYVERIVQKNNPKVLSTQVDDEEFTKAMKEIVQYNPNIYKLVVKQVKTDSVYEID